MTNNFHKLYSIEGFVCTHTLYRYCWKKASYQNFITNSSCVFHSYNNFCLIALPVSFPFNRTVPFPFNFLSHCEFNIWRFISLWRLERNRKHSRFIYLLKWIFSPSHKGTYCKVVNAAAVFQLGGLRQCSLSALSTLNDHNRVWTSVLWFTGLSHMTTKPCEPRCR